MKPDQRWSKTSQPPMTRAAREANWKAHMASLHGGRFGRVTHAHPLTAQEWAAAAGRARALGKRKTG